MRAGGCASDSSVADACMLWIEQALHITVQCYNSDIRAAVTERDGRLWDGGDVVEVFVYFDIPSMKYIELELKARGALLEIGVASDASKRAHPVGGDWQNAAWAVEVDGTRKTRSGWPMYGTPSHNRSCYVCGQYHATGGSACNHNRIDVSTTNALVLSVVRSRLNLTSDERDRFEQGLRELVASAVHDDGHEEEVANLEAELRRAESDLDRMTDNLALEDDARRREAIRCKGDEQATNVEHLKQELGKLQTQNPGPPHSAEERVHEAMASSTACYNWPEGRTATPPSGNSPRPWTSATGPASGRPGKAKSRKTYRPAASSPAVTNPGPSSLMAAGGTVPRREQPRPTDLRRDRSPR